MYSLDISKAFDRVNHVILFNKLADCNVPVKLIVYIYTYLHICYIGNMCQMGSTLLYTIRLSMGVRQLSVLSPSLFYVYVDGMLSELNNSNLRCPIKSHYYNLIMYADDLLIMYLTISDLHNYD